MKVKARVSRGAGGEGEAIAWTPTIAPEKVCELILRVREFQAKAPGDNLEAGSNPSDDAMRVVLEDESNDAVESELDEFIRGLNVDEQVDLVALAWLGRGDGSREEWTSLRAEAAREHNDRTASSYLVAMPMFADYLADALSEFGQTCGE